MAMSLTKKEENRVSAKVFSCISLVVAVALLAAGIGCWKASAEAEAAIKKGLTSAKIYFPAKGSPGFDAQVFPEAQKHAGKQVVDGVTAKAYAENFLAVQSTLIGGGKTFGEVSAQAAGDPLNTVLQRQQSILFQLNTGKSFMLGIYGSSVQAKMIQKVGLILLATAGILLVVASMQYMRYKKLQ
jgi:hypothetical protein